MLMLAVAGVVVRTLARGQQDARRVLVAQTWHLRQLVPTRLEAG
jgi:hypothetical protein